MVLAIGILVDDAIVVVENVERVMEEEPNLSPRDATKKAMAEITAPIIAITLVLLSVFVPIAFIPGISGTLFRQFAVTISVAMLISALNALTLSPALCAVFLRPSGPKRGPMGWVLRRALARPISVAAGAAALFFLAPQNLAAALWFSATTDLLATVLGSGGAARARARPSRDRRRAGAGGVSLQGVGLRPSVAVAGDALAGR